MIDRHGLVPVVLVKNDLYFLPYVLESMRDRFERYVIYDVGSTDDTDKVIDWFTSTEKADFIVRKLPDCPPIVQGTFRNSMIAEAGSEWYWILDGDEIYSKEDLNAFELYWENFRPRGLYGLFERVEFASSDLKTVYKERRSHHRIYSRKATWKGTHPGEEAVIEQNSKNEDWILADGKKITCWHFHNALRSPKETDTYNRMKRKSQRSYHPGNFVEPINLLDILPVLRKQIADFPVNPDLKILQDSYVPL